MGVGGGSGSGSGGLVVAALLLLERAGGGCVAAPKNSLYHQRFVRERERERKEESSHAPACASTGEDVVGSCSAVHFTPAMGTSLPGGAAGGGRGGGLS